METIPERWLQFLFVAVPVLSLIGAWMGLRTVGRLERRRQREARRNEGGTRERSDSQLD